MYCLNNLNERGYLEIGWLFFEFTTKPNFTFLSRLQSTYHWFYTRNQHSDPSSLMKKRCVAVCSTQMKKIMT